MIFYLKNDMDACMDAYMDAFLCKALSYLCYLFKQCQNILFARFLNKNNNKMKSKMTNFINSNSTSNTSDLNSNSSASDSNSSTSELNFHLSSLDYSKIDGELFHHSLAKLDKVENLRRCVLWTHAQISFLEFL